MSLRFTFLRWLALAAALAAAPAFAQSLILRPAVVPLAGSIGQGVTQLLTLQNDSDQPLDFVLEARDVAVRNGVRVFIEAGKLAGSVAATAVFSPTKIRVEPRSSASVTATFTLPPGLEQRAVVAYFRGATTVQSGDRKALLSLGTLFTFTLSDRHSLRAEALVAQPPTHGSNLRLQTGLVNDGDEPELVTGMAVIVDGKGRMVGKVPFKPHRLLPGEKGQLAAEYGGDLAPGSYRTVATLDFSGRPLTLTAPLDVP